MSTKFVVKYDRSSCDRDERDTWYGLVNVEKEDLPIMTRASADNWAKYYNSRNRDRSTTATILHYIRWNDQVIIDDAMLNTIKEYNENQDEIRLKNQIENTRKELAKLEKSYSDKHL